MPSCGPSPPTTPSPEPTARHRPSVAPADGSGTEGTLREAEIAGAVLLLASYLGRSITGQALGANAGQWFR